MTDTPPHLHDSLDELLVIRCQLGERPAFDELIDRWHAPLWKYARRLSGDDEPAHEIVQDVWLRVLRGIHRLRDAAKFRAWLFGIARRVVMDRLRVRYAAPAVADVDLETIAADDAPAADDLEQLQQELERLPIVERDVLTLFYLNELSLAEIAEVLGVPAGTVKSRLHRARRMLRAEMNAQGAQR